jgi:hypothetical protein
MEPASGNLRILQLIHAFGQVLFGQRTAPYGMAWQVLLPMVGESKHSAMGRGILQWLKSIIHPVTRFAPHR